MRRIINTDVTIDEKTMRPRVGQNEVDRGFKEGEGHHIQRRKTGD